MANTDSGSSPTKRNTTAKGKEDSENAGQPLGLTKDQMIFLATASVEAARMQGIRDAAPDKTHFRNNFKIIQSLYEELVL